MFIVIIAGFVIVTIMRLIENLRRKNFIEHFIIITIVKITNSLLRILYFEFVIKLIKLIKLKVIKKI